MVHGVGEWPVKVCLAQVSLVVLGTEGLEPEAVGDQ